MVSTTIESIAERRHTVADVQRELLAYGCGRSASSIRRAGDRGVVTPLRTPGLGVRLYSDADILTLRDVFFAGRGGIVLPQRARFELRISDEDRDRLRALAGQQAQTESDAIRALIREAHVRVGDDSKTGKEGRLAA